VGRAAAARAGEPGLLQALLRPRAAGRAGLRLRLHAAAAGDGTRLPTLNFRSLVIRGVSAQLRMNEPC
jgi:hypothetical protein